MRADLMNGSSQIGQQQQQQSTPHTEDLTYLYSSGDVMFLAVWQVPMN